jgi:glycosyltransferase involved in cell wall biosynthesis
MNQPEFSVIIPTFKEESAIGDTLSSIHHACDGHNTETIVVDGGSPDKTLEIARQFTDNVHILRDRGVAKARNYGALKARGGILVFLDSDTRVPRNFFDELSLIFQNPAVCGVNCNVMPCPDSQPTHRERAFYRLWGNTRKAFYRLRPCGTGDNGIIIRSQTFADSGGFNEDMHTMEDIDFMFRASRHGRFLFLKHLTLRESMRRIRRIGLLRFSAIYLYNFFYYLVRRKPRISSWEPIR